MSAALRRDRRALAPMSNRERARRCSR